MRIVRVFRSKTFVYIDSRFKFEQFFSFKFSNLKKKMFYFTRAFRIRIVILNCHLIKVLCTLYKDCIDCIDTPEICTYFHIPLYFALLFIFFLFHTYPLLLIRNKTKVTLLPRILNIYIVYIYIYIYIYIIYII